MPDLIELGKFVSHLGAGMASVVTLIYLVIFGMPRLFREAKEQNSELFKSFSEELAAERKQCHDDHVAQLASLEKLQEGIARLLERRPR
jgi:hypothetical protein